MRPYLKKIASPLHKTLPNTLFFIFHFFNEQLRALRISLFRRCMGITNSYGALSNGCNPYVLTHIICSTSVLKHNASSKTTYTFFKHQRNIWLNISPRHFWFVLCMFIISDCRLELKDMKLAMVASRVPCVTR